MDSGRIYVIGYGEGGCFIPRIDQLDTAGEIAGYVSLAGSAVSLFEHNTRMMINNELRKGTDSATIAGVQALVPEYIRQIAAFNEDNRVTGIPVKMGYRPAYWMYFADYDAPAVAKTIAEPMLFLWGEHDSEVPESDFLRWQAVLRDVPHAKFIRYPGLCHTFVETKAKDVLLDYTEPGTVDRQVSADIAAFILGE